MTERREGLTRRGVLVGSAIGAGATAMASFVAPISAYAAEAGPITIKDIESFVVEIPVTPAAARSGVSHRFAVTRVSLANGVRGYSFSGAADSGAFAPSRGEPAAAAAERAKQIADRRRASDAAFRKVRAALIGRDAFAIEQHLGAGLGEVASVEEALWDAIGKSVNQPVHRLLGGVGLTSIPIYLTYVWPGGKDQSHILPKEQGAQAGRIARAGFRAMKIRMFRPDYRDDVTACSEMLAAGGAGFKVMVDRTAAASGQLWDYPTALAAAKALEQAGVAWLEEPFARDDYDSPARLALEMDDLLITGGEGFHGLDPYRECLMRRSFDIIQPDLRGVGGLWTTRKVSILAEAFNVPMIQHGAEYGLPVAGRIQAAAAFGAPMVEFISVAPPLTPQEQWQPALKILDQKEVFTFKDGRIEIPEQPGLGLAVNEQALRAFTV